jgi:hypothetical protein
MPALDSIGCGKLLLHPKLPGPTSTIKRLPIIDEPTILLSKQKGGLHWNFSYLKLINKYIH